MVMMLKFQFEYFFRKTEISNAKKHDQKFIYMAIRAASQGDQLRLGTTTGLLVPRAGNPLLDLCSGKKNVDGRTDGRRSTLSDNRSMGTNTRALFGSTKLVPTV
jgi:hypothetical protein